MRKFKDVTLVFAVVCAGVFLLAAATSLFSEVIMAWAN